MKGINQKSIKVIKKSDIYKGLPPKIRKKVSEVVELKGNLLILDEFFPKANWEFLKEMSSKLTSESLNPFFLVMPFIKGVMLSLGIENDRKINLSIMSMGEKSMHFVDNEVPKYYTILGSVDIPCFLQFCNIEGITCQVFSTKKIEPNKKYYFEGIKIPLHTTIKTVNSRTNITEHIYFVTKFYELHEDYSRINEVVPFVGSIKDLSLIWDFRNDVSVYSDVENYILLANIFFMENGIDAFDLILCGEGGTKKSTCGKMIARIFDEKFMMVTNATKKGLVPSFYGEQVKMGVLLDSKFITIIDDFFRFFSQNTHDFGIKGSIMAGLEQIMNILDRSKVTIPSGKSDIDVKYECSFLATDNFKFSEDIKRIYQEDSALFRRYTFLLLSKETTEKAKSLDEEDIETIFLELGNRLNKVFNVKRHSLDVYRLIFKFMREKLKQVEYDKQRVNEIYNRVVANKIYFKSVSRAVIKSVIVLNSLFRAKDIKELDNNLVGQDSDYILYEEILKRLYDDFCKAVGID